MNGRSRSRFAKRNTLTRPAMLALRAGDGTIVTTPGLPKPRALPAGAVLLSQAREVWLFFINHTEIDWLALDCPM